MQLHAYVLQLVPVAAVAGQVPAGALLHAEHIGDFQH